MQSISHYRQKLIERGLVEILVGRLRWYKLRFQMDNWYVGRFVELTGDRIKLQNVTIAVDNPLVSTRHKGSIYFGIYEIAERELSSEYIDRSLPTVEIGASIGGVACVVNRQLEYPSRHVVLECNPILLPTLEKNRKINGAAFTIEPCAIGYGAETISFTISDHFMMGGTQVADGKKVTVQSSSLERILTKYQFKTINLISDCEGAEADLIDHEPDIMRDHVKWFIVETHEMNIGQARFKKMMLDLDRLGFVVEAARDAVVAFKNNNL
jgi:FkbM family methyltransferase